MYNKNFYKGLKNKEIEESIRQDGFEPKLFNDPAGFVYPPHHHKETKLLAFLEGAMEVTVEKEIFNCSAGDKLIIPANIQHAALVGPQGCSFYWSER